jgi:hypothetical protein
LSGTFTMPCARCGRPVEASPGRLVVACGRCAYGKVLVVQVLRGREHLTMSPTDIVEGIRMGELDGLAWVDDGVEAPCPLAAHPGYRAYFLPGLAERLLGQVDDTPAARARRLAQRVAHVLFLGVMGALAAASITLAVLGPADVGYRARVALKLEDSREKIARSTRELLASPVPEEPRAVLAARAWGGWAEGTTRGLQHAVTASKALVVRSPNDAEAWATLAFFLTEDGTEPALRDAALARSMILAPDGPLNDLVRGSMALADGDTTRARAYGHACATHAPTLLACEELALVAEADLREGAAVRIAAFDSLAQRWPANVRLRVQAARIAVAIDAPSAERRLAVARALAPDDTRLQLAEAQLRYRDGDVALAQQLAAEAPKVQSPEVLVAETDALLLTDPQAALVVIAPLIDGGSDDPAVMKEARRAHAQALVRIAAYGGPGVRARRQAAREALTQLQSIASGAPSTVQLAMMLAELEGRPLDADRAWSLLDTRGAPRRDVARAWGTRATQLLARQDLRGARAAAADAVAADGTEVAPHVVRIVVSALMRDVPGLEQSARDVARLYDMRAGRRLPQGGALEVEPPWGEVNRALDAVRVLSPAPVGLDRALRRADVAMALLREQLTVVRGHSGEDAVDVGFRARGFQRAGNAAEATRLAHRAAVLEPEEASWRMLLAETSVAGREWERAADAVMAVRRLSRAPDAYADALDAEAAAALGQRERLAETANRAISADPLDVATRKLLRRSGVR